MINLLSPAQMHDADAYTIANEPISSIDLMERATKAFVEIFTRQFPDKHTTISVYCGTGNNGGDGLAIARLLKKDGYVNVNIKVARFTEKIVSDFEVNLKKAITAKVEITDIEPGSKMPDEPADLLIDALLGSGLNKSLKTDYAALIEYLNGLKRTVVAVDTPTGFFADGEMSQHTLILKAKLVITFQQPKFGFLLPESEEHMDGFVVADIGLDESFIKSVDTPYKLIEEDDIKRLLKPRKQFVHKGTYGHALIIAGRSQTLGAAVMCSLACLRTGAGLTTACIPVNGLTAIYMAMPEVMVLVRENASKPDIKWDKYSSIAIGPGLGTDVVALNLLEDVFKHYIKPVVIDADALNMLADNAYLFNRLPEKSIITPHMKEFDRLFGDHRSWASRIETIINRAKKYNIYIVLKNRYTIIGTPEGNIYFNPTGNPAMANGGMGDALTGVITSLLAQNYTPLEACLIGVYLHGKAGDELALPNKQTIVSATQVANHLPFILAKLLT
jgi:NAD(P)H-hydrate epimerase